MRAIATIAFGAAPALLDLPRPEPADGEVLVRVQTSSMNGFDGSVAAGHLQGMMEHRFPVVLGKDFAGIVESVGSGVSRFAVGDAVFGVVMKAALGDGAFGEYVTVPEGLGIAHRPVDLDVASAGVLGLAGTAAVQSVDAVAAGQLRLHIARTYRLEDAPQALADFGSPHLGKLAIAIA